MKVLHILVFTALACPALAADWALRATDRALTRDEVVALTAGQTMVFHDDGRSKYSVGGAYSYTYASGEAAYGTYDIADDGTVCVAYRNGFARCDRYVENGGKIVLLTEKGLRFPIRQQEKN
jgi:hypothetical protein